VDIYEAAYEGIKLEYRVVDSNYIVSLVLVALLEPVGVQYVNYYGDFDMLNCCRGWPQVAFCWEGIY